MLSALIVFYLAGVLMNFPINFNGQSNIVTIEVKYKSGNRMLAPEPQPIHLLATNQFPQPLFRFRHILPQRTGISENRRCGIMKKWVV